MRNRKKLLDLLRRMARLSGVDAKLATLAGEVELHVVWVSEPRIAMLNSRFLGHAGTTDVIAFDLGVCRALPSVEAKTCVPKDSSGKTALNLIEFRKNALNERGFALSSLSKHRHVDSHKPEPDRLLGAVVANPASPSEEPVVGGEIYVCPAVARRAATGYRTTPEFELALYMVHGMLHLAGEDDLDLKARRRMRRREAQIMRQLPEARRLRELFCFDPDP